MKKIRAGIFGLSHQHVKLICGALKSRPDAFEIVGFSEVYPTDTLTTERPYFISDAKDIPEYKDYKDLIDQKLDLAIVLSDNASKGKLCAELLKKGLSVLDEKPMAMSYTDAREMYLAAKGSGALMLTNWPVAWFPSFRKAKELLDAGKIGKLMRVVYRTPATWGPFSYSEDGSLPPENELKTSWWYKAECGGGSLLDYACYGTLFATWYFGKQAEKVTCTTKQFTTGFSDVEDYSLITLDFGDGIGVAEGSWCTYNSGEVPTGPILYGTDGVIVCDRYSNQIKLYNGKSHTPTKPTEVFEVSGPQIAPMLADALVSALIYGNKPDELISADFNLAVVASLDAAIESAKTGKTVKTKKIEGDK